MLSGVARGFFGPSVFAVLPQTLFFKRGYANAVSWNATFWQAALLAGPIAGSFAYYKFGASSSFLIDSILMGCSVFSFAMMALFRQHKKVEKEKNNREHKKWLILCLQEQNYFGSNEPRPSLLYFLEGL